MPRLHRSPEFESDDDSARNPTQGGVSAGDSLAVGGDLTGRDKITAGGHVIQAGAGATVIISAAPEPVAEGEPPAEGLSPFKGLHYFDEADADLFFGREALVAKLSARLNPLATDEVADAADGFAPPTTSVTSVNKSVANFLAIIGASGSGKSSLVRAGLIPALRREHPDWPVHVITPTAQPLESLAISLTRGSESVTAADTLINDLRQSQRSLHLYARRLLGSNTDHRLLLVVDQFEELFTACKDETERKAFIGNLMMAINSPSPADASPAGEGAGGWGQTPTLLILTLRADFYAHCAQYDSLREAVAKQQEYIGPMTADELRRAIEEPARLGDWELEPGLVEALLNDVGADGEGQPEPGALPLLSHALLETWNRRRGRGLTLRGYAESGGVREAIARSAEQVYAQLTPAGQIVARNIFVRLTELGEGTQDTRRRVALDELTPKPEDVPAVQAVLKLLADARLVTTEASTAEVAHEALIREWPALRRWLNEDREGLRLHRQLTKDAQAWAGLNRDEGALYRGARLAQAGEWAEKNDDQLSALERGFLNASRTLQVSELEAAKKRAAELRRRALYLAGALVLALAAFITAGLFSVQATQSANAARTAEAQAVAQKQTAVAAQAVADQQRDEAERQAQIAFAGKLAAQAQTVHEEEPLLGIRLALESFAFAPAEAPESRESTADTIRNLLAPGRVLKLGDDIEAIHPNSDSTFFVLDRSTQLGELWRTADGSQVETLTGFVSKVYFGSDPQASYFVVAYDDQPSELRRMADGSKIETLTGFVSKVYFGSNPQTDYFIVAYIDHPGELRRTADGSQVETLTGIVSKVLFSPNPQASYFVVAYDDQPDELRRITDGSTVETLTGVVESVFFSPDPQASYFVVDYGAQPGELRRMADGSAIETLPGVVSWVYFSSNPSASYFVVDYVDQSGELRRTTDGSQVETLVGVVSNVLFNPDPRATFFVVDYVVQPGEMRRTTDGSQVETLTSVVEDVFFSPDPQAGYFVVGYVAQPGELRHASDGSLVRILTGVVANVFPSPNPQASYFVLDYLDQPSELRRTADGSRVDTLTGDVYNVFFSSDLQADYAVMKYLDQPGEVWRMSDGSQVETLTGFVSYVDFSPDAQATYFVVFYSHDASELWTTGDKPRRLARLGLGLATPFLGSPFEMSSQRLIARYSDGRAYLWDMALLSALDGDPAALSAEELMRIACEHLFAPDTFDVSQLAPYLDGQEARACK